jgi:hypothetical protein
MIRLISFKRLTALCLILLLLAAAPLSAWAAGITQPTGTSAGTFSYNDKTGLWENDYFTWSPITYIYTPKFDQPYTYNQATGMYDAPNWVYVTSDAKYEPTTISVAQPPAGATVIGGPPAPAPAGDDGSGGAANDALISTGPDSSSDTGGQTSDTASLDSKTGIGVSNQISGTAASGDATVSRNTLAGSAASGDAAVSATVLNSLQSQTSLQGNTATFTYDIYGNVQGDLLIDPNQLSNINTSVSNDPSKLAINTSTDAAIDNDIDLTAASGDATVSQNTQAGSATTGTATAVAQIINVINSIISSGQSFVGTINIHGNFDGDILLPQDTLNKVLAANYPTVEASINPDGSITAINNTNNTTINNHVDLAAASGDASVTENTKAGAATTGDASTNLVLLNLTGQRIICGDALLVFVNVLGNWVGMIVNAPSGSTAAALGGNCSTTTMPLSDTDVSSTSNLSINNNINLKANSGDASVSRNTLAGSAASGDAAASANIANIANSALSFSNWFGILFINVFGDWRGSFGIDTVAGGIKDNSGPTGGQTVQARVFHFVPKTAPSTADSRTFAPPGPSVDIQNPGPTSSDDNRTPTVLASTNDTGGPAGPAGQQPNHATSLLWTAGSLFVLAGIITTEEAITRRKEARAKLRRYIHGITVQPFKQY